MKTTSPSLIPLPLPEANGYYSTEDEQRMQAMVRALLQGRRPIALSSASSEALDHYSRLLVRDLRQQDHVKVVAHLPGSCDKLVQQVNELLADVPLSHVVARDSAVAKPIHVFVVHDSPTLSSAEFALLVRLVNDLPGANLRIALIQDRDFAVTGNLQALGAQALHWRIQVAGMPVSTSSAASREALREALRESPETLPPWARPADKKPKHRRWRLAFWRREEPQAVAKPGKPVAKPAPGTSPRTTSRTSSGSARTATKVATENTAARRNRVILVSGVLLSAALAGALGTWLSIQPANTRAAKPAGPTTTMKTPSHTTAAIATRMQP